MRHRPPISMWFMNRIANPAVRLILRSPAHGFLSAAVLLVSYRGRRSGMERTLPVQYAQDGDTLYLLPGGAERKTWWRNLRDGASVRITLRGENLSGHAVLLEGASDRDAMVAGLRCYLQRFPALAPSYRVRLDSNGAFDDTDLRAAAESLRLVRVKLNASRGAT
jgi:deazaflavin-dependent oxidoreductase (nitroreductase family)